MKFFRRQWEAFKAKSLLGKLSDVFFVLLLLVVLTKDGRILMQRALLSTGVFGGIEANADEELTAANWNWTMTDLDGNTYRLADFKGQAMFINFWATWCPPCNAEMPYIQEMVDETSGDVVHLLLTSEDPSRVKAYLKDKGWTLPVYIVYHAPEGVLKYSSLPTSLVVDVSGKLIHRSEGMRKWTSEGLREMLEE